MKNQRQIAVEALLAIAAKRHVQEVLNYKLALLPEKERQFSADLVYGVLRTRIRLDCILRRVLAMPEKLPPSMLASLELALYSLLFQTGAPAYAILNETVNLVKKNNGQKLANVANGALRSILRLGEKPKGMAFYGERGESCFYAMPEEIAEIWRNAYGNAAASSLLKRSFERPWTGLRVNLCEPVGPELLHALLESPYAQKVADSGVAFPPGMTPESAAGKMLTEWRANGALSFQSAGSQLVLHNLGIFSAWGASEIWDACAGGGGKTGLLLENGLNVKFATDTSFKRLVRLPEECRRLHLRLPVLAQANAAKPPLKAWQGNILVDAPCSGLGVLARRPDIRLRFDRQRIEGLIAIQADILGAACELLLPGRELAYITCTLNPAENERQVEELTAANMELVAQWQTPHDHPWLEGMFGARLRRKAVSRKKSPPLWKL